MPVLSDMISILFFILACLLVFLLWIMIYDSNRFKEVFYRFTSSKVKKNVRCVFLSDLHNKQYGKENVNLLAAIKKLNPDIILVGGDILTAKPKAKTGRAEQLIKSLEETAPVFYALGNHEYRAQIYPETYGTMYQDYMEAIKSDRLAVLDNAKAVLKEYNICITGLSLDRKYYKRFVKRELEENYLKDMLGEKKKDCYEILLAHNPEYLKDYSVRKPDLVLSGHMHGGVARIPKLGGVISPALRPFPHYDGGLYEEYGTRMVLSRGLGMHTIPVRLFNPGELVIIDIEGENK